jgi:hypothetical protein
VSMDKTHTRVSQRGYGLVLMMLFLATTVMVMLSLQMTTQTSVGQVMISAQNNVLAGNLAKTGLAQARDKILTDLDASTLNPLLDSGAGSPATWSYTSPVSVPSDPSNLGSAPVQVGSFTATITRWGADGWYVVKSVGTANGASVTVSDLMNIQPSYRCSVQGAATESAILAGNITTLTNDDLRKYAQNNCMLKSPPAGVAAYSVTAGTGADCDTSPPSDNHSGSGTLDLGNTTGTCYRSIQGTYSLVHLGSHSTSQWISIHNTSGALTEVHATDITGASGGIEGWNMSANTNSNSPLFLKLNSLSNGSEAYGSTANDTVSLTGDVNNGWIQTLAGNDTVIIGGTFTGGSWSESLDTGSGNDTVYIRETNVNLRARLLLGTGSDAAYLGSFIYSDIHGDTGNDIISCTSVLGSGGCTAWGGGSWTYAEGGNDIISIDQMVIGTALGAGSNTLLDGGTGNNIIYAKGLSDTTYEIDVNASTSSGAGTGSLVIIGGNRTRGKIRSTGANNVLLLKAGTTSTNTTVCGAAFNDTQTSCANFARILWY